MSQDTSRTVATLRGLTAKFDQRVQNSVPYYPTKCNIVPSNGRDEGYGMLGSMPGVREWVGDRVFNSLSASQFTIMNRLWENSVAIDRVDIEDDRLGMYDIVMDELAQEAVFHPDSLMLDLQTKGDSQVCMDGQYFYDVDHSWGKSGNQSNKLTCPMSVAKWVAGTVYVAGAIVQNSGNQYVCVIGGTSAGSGGPTTTGAGITDNTVTWNYQSLALPTQDDIRRAYFQMTSAILGFKKDNGQTFYRPTLQPVDDFVLECPLAMQDVTEKALLKSLINGGETNLVVNGPKVVTIPGFTDNLSVYLHRVKQPLKPFVFQNRQPLTRMMKGMDDREYKDVKFMTDARYNAGYLAWWQSCKLTFQ